MKMVMKTLEENSKNASHVIQTAVGMLAQSEGWKIAVQKAKVIINYNYVNIQYKKHHNRYCISLK